MTGYYWAIGHCINCGNMISFNPDYVPSIRVDGEKEPLCRGCAQKWNQIHRISKGLEPVSIHPQAYQPQPEVGEISP
jgi:hypothetical protein